MHSPFFDSASRGNPGVTCVGGSLLYLEGNPMACYTWGLGATKNNISKSHALYLGLKLAKEYNISHILVVDDSMMIFRAVIKINLMENNHLNDILHHIISLSDSFWELKLYHIKKFLNPLANHWVKVGSRMPKGEINVNGERGSTCIP
jgi:ribonuclease HI